MLKKSFGNIFGNKNHFQKPKWPETPTRRVVNLSLESTYLLQTENVKKPHSSCNTTSFGMGLDITKWDESFNISSKTRLPDYLTSFFESDLAFRMRKTLVGETSIPPQQLHAVLEWGVNYLCGSEVVSFSTNWPQERILKNLDKGLPVVLSGQFPFKNRHGQWTTIGHIVILVGYIWEKDKPLQYIIDDPYGDYHTGYRDRNGNDVLMSQEDFDTIIRTGDRGGKWGHLFLSKKS